MFDRWFWDPVNRLKLSNDFLPAAPPATFACSKCHRLQSFGGCDKNEWNQLIFHLSGGMLYGKEVPKPAGYRSQRKRTRVRQLNRPAPRRQMVLRRLLNGWSINRIARDMQVTPTCIRFQIKHLCAQENVKNRHELAKKLRAPVMPPLNQTERARLRYCLRITGPARRIHPPSNKACRRASNGPAIFVSQCSRRLVSDL